MEKLIYPIYAIHILWLLGCVYYCIFTWLSNHQGHGKNERLKGMNLKVILFMVLVWFSYMVFNTYNYYAGCNEYTVTQATDGFIGFVLSHRITIELMNLASSIICTLLLLGFNFNKK